MKLVSETGKVYTMRLNGYGGRNTYFEHLPKFLCETENPVGNWQPIFGCACAGKTLKKCSTIVLLMVIQIDSENFVVIARGKEIKMHVNQTLDSSFHQALDLCLNTLKESFCIENIGNNIRYTTFVKE